MMMNANSCYRALSAALLACLCLINNPICSSSLAAQAVPLEEETEVLDNQLLDKSDSLTREFLLSRVRRSLMFLDGDEDVDPYLMDKRSAPDFVPVMFKCRRQSAKCMNGGLGPKVSRRMGLPVCMCMCPYGYSQAQCRPEWWVNNV